MTGGLKKTRIGVAWAYRRRRKGKRLRTDLKGKTLKALDRKTLIIENLTGEEVN